MHWGRQPGSWSVRSIKKHRSIPTKSIATVSYEVSVPLGVHMETIFLRMGYLEVQFVNGCSETSDDVLIFVLIRHYYEEYTSFDEVWYPEIRSRNLYVNEPFGLGRTGG